MKLPFALLIVDFQNDFCPGGALPVPEANTIVGAVNKYLRLFSSGALPVFASRDWHPAKTTHFKRYGGVWPDHCIANTEGAGFHPELKLPQEAVIISKGTEPDKDAYSAFQAKSVGGEPFSNQLQALKIEQLFIGGLATDYCVKFSALDALERHYKVIMLTDAIRGVNIRQEDSKNALIRMKKSGAQEMMFEEVAALLRCGSKKLHENSAGGNILA